MRPSHEGKPHVCAKQRVARWIRLAAAHGAWGGMLEGCRVRVEMPLALNRNGDLVMWHDEPWGATRTPGSRELRNKGFWVPWRLDIGVTKPGAIVLGIEIENAFSVRDEKATALQRMPFPTFELSADWVNEQARAPSDWTAGILNRFGVQS